MGLAMSRNLKETGCFAPCHETPSLKRMRSRALILWIDRYGSSLSRYG